MAQKENTSPTRLVGKMIGDLPLRTELKGTERIPFQDGEENGSLSVDALKGEIVHRDTFLKFPTVGHPHALYVDTTDKKSYCWDDAQRRYVCVGWGFEEDDTIVLDSNL